MACNYSAIIGRVSSQLLTVRGKSITPGLSFQNRFAIFPSDFDLQLGNRFGFVDTGNFSFSRYGISDKNGSRELPILAQENSAGARHVHSNQGMKEPGRYAALNNQLLKLGFRCKGFIEMNGIVVAGQVPVCFDVIGGKRHAAYCLLSDG